MSTERKWEAVPPQNIQSNGESSGLLTIPDTSAFKVKQKVKLKSTTKNTVEFEVKRVVSPTQLYLGLVGRPIFEYSDLTQFTTADSAVIYADEQDRSPIIPDAFNRAKYEEEPVMAERVVLVDKNGRKYDLNNPLPTNATFTGSLTVNLSGAGPTGDTVGVVGENGNRLVINPDGSMTVNDPALVTILTSIFNVLDSGTLNVNDSNTQSALVTVIGLLNDIYTFQSTNTQSVSDSNTHSKLDAVITALSEINLTLSNLDADTLWTKLSKSVDRSRVSNYSDVVVGGRTLKRLDYVEYSAASVSVSQKIRVSYTWLDFGTKDERVGPITRSVLPI